MNYFFPVLEGNKHAKLEIIKYSLLMLACRLKLTGGSTFKPIQPVMPQSSLDRLITVT
jgi:hypothetical protein